MRLRSRIAGFLSGTNIELLADVLRGVGRFVQPKCITKRVCPNQRAGPREWSRSELWFFIRAVIQLSCDRLLYKAFMLFFMCNLADHAINTRLSSVLLYSMSAKILRRFAKLGSSAPLWLRGNVFRVCTGLSQTLDERWQDVQSSSQSSSDWNPSKLDLTKDIQPSLSQTHEYISSSLANHGDRPIHTPFLPNSPPRGTLNDFLFNPFKFLSLFSEECDDDVGSSFEGHDDGVGEFFLQRYNEDAYVGLYDVERAIREELGNWVARVTNVDKACEQLNRLAHAYHSLALCTPPDTDRRSIMFLTIIELWIALDRLVVKEIPILADYSPEISMSLFSKLLLRDAMNIQRFFRAYQYLFARHSQAHPRWSAFSSEFTEHSLPCRLYDSFLQLRRLKDLEARIQDTLPLNPLHAKVVIFELECPVFLNTWRSVTCWISAININEKRHGNEVRIQDIPALEPHFDGDRVSRFSLYSSPSAPQLWDTLCYGYEGLSLDRFECVYELPTGPYRDSGLQRYLEYATHTPNEVLAAQASCHSDLPSHVFLTFAHLRSGGSLQWFNILLAIRSRALDFRREEVYLLFLQASAQVGPLDSTGKLLWHQELQNVSFCHALLNELESLFVDIGVGSLNGPGMATISLLAGMLASRCVRDIAGRAVQLLRDVRWKTFGWVHELVCEMRKSPANKEGLKLLRDMATVCRSTFDAGSAATCKLLCSAQDIEIALCCSMLIYTTYATFLGMSDPQIDSDVTPLTLPY